MPKKAKRTCNRGHHISFLHQPGDPCPSCEADLKRMGFGRYTADHVRHIKAAEAAREAKAERIAANAELGPIPRDMTIFAMDGGRITYRCPPLTRRRR